ncbi:hypothetical protein KUW15_02365 [Qipengyuania aquimaris]|uniref:hypothetical protein n=1 Tax=Qipengyuania aquimaris TaxID=255984 RepID=UPI001C9448C2|nr:hypothetical protein [Qipengyuania aquimaris]MBY6127552.1 hypothetical protein [Qipengyuania aquimaris]
MEQVLDILEGISGWSWGWLVAAFLAALTIESWPHLTYRFWQWRIDRAFRDRGELLQEDLRELEWKQGARPEPFQIGRVLSVSLQSALQLFLPVVLVDTVAENDLVLLPAAIAAAAWFAQSREPEKDGEEDYSGPGGYDVPPEAKVGFLAAIAMLCVIALVVFTFGY